MKLETVMIIVDRRIGERTISASRKLFRPLPRGQTLEIIVDELRRVLDEKEANIHTGKAE